MTEYRVYWFNAAGHIEAAEDHEWASDQEACSKTSEMLSGFQAVEVWCGARLIARITAPPAAGKKPDQPARLPA
jgi:hypothetical protein